MNTRSHEVAQFKPEQLITSIIMAHEASRGRDTLSELPRHLAVALGAAAVAVTVISLNERHAEAGRVNFTSDTFSITAPDEDDWAAPLLAEAAAGQYLADVLRFAPNSEVHALFPICAASLVAFRIQAPDSVFTLTEGGRSMLASLLQQVAANLRRQSHRPTSKVREKPLLRSLTKAEWRVLIALDSDMPEKQIAQELNTTSNTLHSHIKSIYRRLGVQSRLSAITLLRRAEREVLFEELQASRTANSTNNSGNGVPDPVPSAAMITITPSTESLYRTASFIPFVSADLRAG
jgi:DNA-binding CsgD family transcriptional regulator